MVSLNPMSVNIQTIILGNVLAIAPEDILQLASHRGYLADYPVFEVERSDGGLF